jgi:hypothetical protein
MDRIPILSELARHLGPMRPSDYGEHDERSAKADEWGTLGLRPRPQLDGMTASPPEAETRRRSASGH